MSRKDHPDLLSPDLIAPFDDQKTQPVPMQLIARLAAQDPAVQLKIGMVASAEATPAIEGAEKETKTGE